MGKYLFGLACAGPREVGFGLATEFHVLENEVIHLATCEGDGSTPLSISLCILRMR